MYWKVRDILLYFLFDVCGNCIRNYTENKVEEKLEGTVL